MQASTLPVYKLIKQEELKGTTYSILTHSEASLIPENLRDAFLSQSEVTHNDNGNKTIFITPQKASKATIQSNINLVVSSASADANDYLGNLTDFLTSAYKFSRKQIKHIAPIVSIVDSSPLAERLIILTEAKNQARQWGNSRGDVQNIPSFFKQVSTAFANENKLEITVIEGDDLLQQGFRLMHAVGRASINKPVFVNLAYQGNPDSKDWIAFVGKGICFDTGGLNIKSAAGMFQMYTDNCGAINCLSAFQAIVRQKLKVNLTCSLGFAENSINQNAYRPSDIITSRKGLTVEIGNTDAEGRLVLADCMNWVQQKYNVKTLIELSTLTGAVITALGSAFTGFFTNSEDFFKQVNSIGAKVNELSWQLPCSDYHKRLVSPKHCDLTNNSGKSEASASQAAAFLRSFVQEGVVWAHLDIGGTADLHGDVTGWGVRLLTEYARSKQNNQPESKQAAKQSND